MRGAGGTSGGVGEFLLGLGMAIGGGYMLLQKVTVTSGGWYFYGVNAFGLTLIPFLLGAGMLFYNGKSILGWLLMFASLASGLGLLVLAYRGFVRRSWLGAWLNGRRMA